MPPPVAAGPSRPELSSLVANCVADLMGNELDANEPLMAAGMDSLASTELVKKLSVELDSDIPSTLLFDHPTMGAIAAYLYSTIAAAPRLREDRLMPPPVAAGPSRPELSSLVANCVADLMGNELDANEPLMAAGVDSLASTELVKKLSVELDSDIPSTLLFDHPTMGAIAAYLYSNTAPGPRFMHFESSPPPSRRVSLT
ncbi:acyl carrier protein [bacterium]|nr:acyl carrier protein [bacterium]